MFTFGRRTSRSVRSSAPADDDDSHWNVSPGDRIGPPPRRSRLAAALRRIGLVAMLALGGWAYGAGWLPPLEWPASGPAPVAAPPERAASAPLPPVTERAAPEEPQLAPARSDPGPEPAPQTAAPEPETSPRPKAGEPLPPAVALPGDAIQQRAVAAGLHPGLSRVLLSRLSDADYRNAATAIRKAIAETPDDAFLLWPQQKIADLAQFKVHFVEGGAPDCRRYVVTVAKDGWLTTALPMERCGLPQRHRKHP
jgi:hypothetical protein